LDSLVICPVGSKTSLNILSGSAHAQHWEEFSSAVESGADVYGQLLAYGVTLTGNYLPTDRH